MSDLFLLRISADGSCFDDFVYGDIEKVISLIVDDDLCFGEEGDRELFERIRDQDNWSWDQSCNLKSDFAKLQKENDDLNKYKDLYGKALRVADSQIDEVDDLKEENEKLQAENKKLREALELILKNFIKCPQNEHNTPTIEWKYLDEARKTLREIDEVKK